MGQRTLDSADFSAATGVANTSVLPIMVGGVQEKITGLVLKQAIGAPIASDTYANIVSGYPAASYNGSVAFATDMGSHGLRVQSDGSVWNPMITSFIQNTAATGTIIFSGFGCTYSQTGTTITVTATSHGLTSAENGNYIHLTQSTGAFVTEYCSNFTYVDANTFTCTSAVSQSTSGNLGANSSETFLQNVWAAPSWRLAGYAQAPTYLVHCKSNTNSKLIKTYYSGIQANATLTVNTAAASQAYQTTSNTIRWMSATTFMLTNNNGGVTGNGIINTEVNSNFSVSVTLSSGGSAADWALVVPYFSTGNWRI